MQIISVHLSNPILTVRILSAILLHPLLTEKILTAILLHQLLTVKILSATVTAITYSDDSFFHQLNQIHC